MPLGNWFIWLLLAGRGFGKTRTGAETVLRWYREGHERINLAARTTGDIRKTMLFGISGIITKAPPHERPRYITSLRELHWPDGRVSLCFSADEPEQGRGPASDKLWADELGAWGNWDLWHNLMMGLREGKHPQALVTTTGRRVKILREMEREPDCHVTRGNTFDNSHNLSARYLRYMQTKYEGTTLGLQELGGEILGDLEGAFWIQEHIDALSVPEHPRLTRVVIGVDPAITNTKKSDRIGIVVVGLGVDGHGYVLADLSFKGSPGQWVQRILWAYKTFNAQLIKAERNRGGDLIEYCLRMAAEKGEFLPNISTFNSQESKAIRAEPCATLYAKKLIHHVRLKGDPAWAELEGEMCDWDPALSTYSPNAIDALCFAILELFPNMEPHVDGFQIEPKTGLYLPTNRIYEIQQYRQAEAAATPAAPGQVVSEPPALAQEPDLAEPEEQNPSSIYLGGGRNSIWAQ